MKFLLTTLLCGSVGVFSACHSVTTDADPPALDHQHYRFAGSTRCDTTTNQGVEVSVSYVQLRDDSEGAQKINDNVRQLAVGSVVSWLSSTTIAAHPDARTDLDKATTLFVADYQAVREDMGGLGGCWELKTSADTLHASPKALTVKVETFAYTGGAHPNSNLAYYTFDRETGEPLTLTDMVSDTTALLGVVERAFRQQQELLPQNDLEERGYFLRDGRFFLPTNVGMNQQGLVFHYNPYEIAAYAIGPIEVTVPYEQLDGILRDDWR